MNRIMKRKATRKSKPANVKNSAKAREKRPAPTATQSHDNMGALVAASAQALGLAIEPAWEANISFNLHLILRHAALVDEFPLPDDAEPAPVFQA
jgi:hypothetical protein